MNELQAVRRVHRVAREVVALVDQAAAAVGLTAAEVDVLGALADLAPCAVGRVAHETGYRPSTLTAILDRLARRGWIRRALSAADRRSFVVELTRDGRGAARHLGRRLAALDRAMRRELPRRELVALADLPVRVGAHARPGPG